MIFKTFGSRCLTSQIDRIEDGFRELGHKILSDEGVDVFNTPDVIYCNDISCADQAWDYRKQHNGDTVYVQTVLDIPEHLPNLDQIVEEIRRKVERADIVCSISKFVQKQLIDYLGIESHVIHQPTKNVFKDGDGSRYYKYLIVGRNRDPNKQHSEITLPAIWELEKSFNDLYVVGEDIGHGNYLGAIDNEVLNVVYNRSEYIFTPSKIEGLCLPRFEAAICCCKPICLSWDKVAREFFEPIIVGPSYKHVVDAIKSEEWNHLAECFVYDKGPEFKKMLSGKVIASNIINLL